jgi:hypothetical protein
MNSDALSVHSHIDFIDIFSPLNLFGFHQKIGIHICHAMTYHQRMFVISDVSSKANNLLSAYHCSHLFNSIFHFQIISIPMASPTPGNRIQDVSLFVFIVLVHTIESNHVYTCIDF